MKVFHLAYKKEVTVSALADARQVINACRETIEETNKMLKGLKSLAYSGHKGVDAWSSWGSKIYATHDGIVSWSRDEGDVGGGVWLEITRTGLYSAHHSGQDAEQYKHFRRGSVVVKQGQRVKKGDLLGIQGSTGNSTGEHLHYEVIRGGKRVDPLPYLKGEELPKLFAHNTNDLKLLMLTAGAFVFKDTAQKHLDRVLKDLPELKKYAGIRFSPSSSAGKYQIVLARLEGKIKECEDYAEDLRKKVSKDILIEVWGW